LLSGQRENSRRRARKSDKAEHEPFEEPSGEPVVACRIIVTFGMRFSSSMVAGLVLVASLNAAAQSQTPQPIVGSNQAQETNQGRVVLPIFAFHSGFWVNLHHFLYAQARELDRASPAASEQPDRPLPSPALSAGEQRQWRRAVNYYTANLAGQDLEFNGDMVLLNNRLAELETCGDIDGTSSARCASGLRPELVMALEEAAPIYRAHWWPEQDRENRAWITAAGQLIRQYGAALSQALVGAYQAPWPANPIRVDVVGYAGRWGAYGSINPLHIVVASTDSRNQGLAALAVVFNEASQAFAPDVAEALAKEFRDQNKLVRRDLWQALLFYTAAEMVEGVLNGPRGTMESPAGADWVVQGLKARGWQAYIGLLEHVWQPYLDKQIDFPTAIHLMVGQL